MPELTEEERSLVANLVALFKERRTKLTGLLTQVEGLIQTEIQENGKLFGLVHSTKSRIKDPQHLEEKLYRKILDGKETGKPYDVTLENFFYKVNDLVGLRIMHLHPRQMELIHPIILELLKERKLELTEDPAARVWDLETEKYFRNVVGLKTVHTEDKLYSSVHYVVLSNWTTKYTCEIQVRTLADEVWGEVDHKINYPARLDSIACTEQIKSLAHITTSCNRLVDSIFASHKEWDAIGNKPQRA